MSVDRINLKTRERQSLAIVATLVDNVPNLAGLVRTSEIFCIEELVIANKQILKVMKPNGDYVCHIGMPNICEGSSFPKSLCLSGEVAADPRSERARHGEVHIG